ncbi:MAG: NADH-quinone oxidoreductase subunit [Actinomycetota bacterium]|nr:NADH-quinone oxidoreductase subunit [Actinomycetota bacterium]
MPETLPIRYVLDWGPRFTLSVLNLGLACCAIEFVAASMRPGGPLRQAASADGERIDAEVLVVAGTVTDVLGPAVLRLYDAMPAGRRYVMSFGACSNSGGPYWDSYSVTNGVDQLIPVDVYIPGCPPRPEALLHGLLELQQRIGGVQPTRTASAAPLVLGGRPAPPDLRRPG